MTGEAGVTPDAWQACGFSRVTVGSRRDTYQSLKMHTHRDCRSSSPETWGSRKAPLPKQNNLVPGQLHNDAGLAEVLSLRFSLFRSLHHSSAKSRLTHTPTVPRGMEWQCLPVL